MGWFGKNKETMTEQKPEEQMKKQLSEKEKRTSIQKVFDENCSQVVAEMEQLASGQMLTYKLPELYWSNFAAFIIAELNPEYPKKGKKYNMFLDGIADGKPEGKKRRYYESNKPEEYAESVITRQGERSG
jgi:hypothetical protein